MRHPELHQHPEAITMPTARKARATIELGQHSDGRWMWAVRWHDGFSGQGYCCAEKWGNFATTRQAALDAAIAEGLEQTSQAQGACPTVRRWLASLSPPQCD